MARRKKREATSERTGNGAARRRKKGGKGREANSYFPEKKGTGKKGESDRGGLLPVGVQKGEEKRKGEKKLQGSSLMSKRGKKGSVRREGRSILCVESWGGRKKRKEKGHHSFIDEKKAKKEGKTPEKGETESRRFRCGRLFR